ncbi:MAG: hypothetical protein ABEH81_01300 [Halopenitus sp.]
MTDINSFNVNGNRLVFELDGEEFIVKWPDEYNWGREHYDLMKDIALCAWSSKLAFTENTEPSVCFDASDDQIGFWLWIAYRINALDTYQTEGESEPFDFREIKVETGSDTGSLIPRTLPDQEYEGALVCQSPGKESVASRIIMEELGHEPIYSMFYEYPSRAATHKIQGREDYEKVFDNPTRRVWSNTNTLQSTLQELTDNFEPVTCFWEIMYAMIATPIMVDHGLKWLMMGNQRDTGEAFQGDGYIAFEEINQSFIFEEAYSAYLTEEHDLPVRHTSNVRPYTGYGSRKIVARERPEFLQYMQNCIKPKPANKWCGTCYKCNNSWVEFLACGIDPAEAGLDHDVLVENPHLGADQDDDWGFSFPRYARDEHVWKDEGGEEFFHEEVVDTLTEEQMEAFKIWRSRQEERVDEDDYQEMKENNGVFIEPIADALPDEVVDDIGLEHSDFVPEALDPNVWVGYSQEWRTFT